MNGRTIILLALLSGTHARLHAQQFEGKILAKGPDKGTATFFVKGFKTRLESHDSGQPYVLLSNTQTSKVYALIPTEKYYSEVPTIKLPVDSEDHADITRTGETKNIHGFTCEKWTYTDGDGRTETWVTNQLGVNFSQIMGHLSVFSGRGGARSELDAYVPMQIVLVNKKGKREVFFEVTSVERMKLSDDLFSIPSDYRQMPSGR